MYDQLTVREFDFVPLWNIRVVFEYKMRRVNCPRCGVKVEKIPWASGKSHTTKAFQLFLAQWARKLSWKETAETFGSCWDTVYRSVKMVVAYGLDHRNLDGITAIGVDEVQYKKGHKYITLVYQINEGMHRLDMDTSGLMVLARTKEAHRELSRQFHDRETGKRYIALLDGVLPDESGTIELPFRLDIDNRPMQIYDPVHGKLGITHWKTLNIEDGKTRVEFIPITGRTHQLRIHAASEHGLGMPIVGDRLYGSGTAPGQLKLHATFLRFTHPSTGKKMEFHSEPDF